MNKDYTFGAYIKSLVGYPWIDTGVTFDELTTVEVDLEVPELTDGVVWSPFGGGTSTVPGSKDLTGVMGGSANLIFYYGGTGVDIALPITPGRYTFVVDNGVLTFGENTYTVSNWLAGFSLPTFYLEQAKTGPNTFSRSDVGKNIIYSAKFYRYTDNTRTTKNLIAEFLPAIRNSDGKAGMYETVAGVFYTTPYANQAFYVEATYTPVYSLTINTDPADASVTFDTAVDGATVSGNTITLPSAGSVYYKVEKEGYISKSQTVNVNSEIVKNVVLVKEAEPVPEPTRKININYDFPWYIQESPVFMSLYTGFATVASNITSLPFIDMLDINNAYNYSELLAAGQYYGVPNAWYGLQDALIYNFREWSPRDEGQTEYYWNGRASADNFRLMANYIRAKVQIRGQPLSLSTLKRFYETALDGYNYSVENNIEIIESEQHFEIVVQATDEIAQALIEMSYTDKFPFGKPVGISYNITYVLAQGV